MKLPIPDILPGPLGHTLFKLIQVSEIVNNSDDLTVSLDFSHTSMLHSVFLGGLHSFITTWLAQGRTVEIINIGESIRRYFSTVRFPEGFDLKSHPHLGHNLKRYNLESFTPIVVFPTEGESRESAIGMVLNVIHQQCKYTGVFKQAVDYFVSELTNNVADHSNEPTGALFAQCYPEQGFIDITIWDGGIGVLASYLKTDKFEVNNEVDAIQAAVNGKSTKDRAESRGFGLSTSRSLIVNGLGGTFLLWSGMTMFIDNVNRKHILKVDDSAFYQGCFLALRLPLHQRKEFDFYKLIE